MENIVVIGASGHAKVVIDILEYDPQYKIIGLIDHAFKPGEQVLGYEILGIDSDLPSLVEKHSLAGVFIAIGDNFVRSKVMARISETCPSLTFITAVHPSASIGKMVSIGAGSVVMAGVSINPCTNVGRFCILNTNSSLDHDSTMGDFSSLAPRVVTGGNCKIGEHSAINIGATILPGVTILTHTVIGAGSAVFNDIESYTVAYGTPAKVIRARKLGDRYL